MPSSKVAAAQTGNPSGWSSVRSEPGSFMRRELA